MDRRDIISCDQVREQRDALQVEFDRIQDHLRSNDIFNLNEAQRNLIRHELKLTNALMDSLNTRILLWPKLERTCKTDATS